MSVHLYVKQNNIHWLAFALKNSKCLYNQKTKKFRIIKKNAHFNFNGVLIFLLIPKYLLIFLNDNYTYNHRYIFVFSMHHKMYFRSD